MIYILDLFGTAVFAITGGFKAVKYELDILGVLVLSTITGVGGGLLRDVLIGDTPPAAFKNEYYLIISLLMGLLVFFLAPKIAKRWEVIKYLDALGLGTFTVIGALKGMDYGLGVVGIIFTGVLTSCGGGLIRDVLVREIPAVIKRDFYATASTIGCLFLIVTSRAGWAPKWLPFLTIILTAGLRIAAMKLKLSLPRVKQIPGFKGSSKD